MYLAKWSMVQGDIAVREGKTIYYYTGKYYNNIARLNAMAVARNSRSVGLSGLNHRDSLGQLGQY